jgi:hypothetical protein
MHLDDGQLHAYLDGELAERDAGQHLAACPACAARLAALKAQAERVSGRLAALAPLPDDPHLAARPALARFQAQRANRKETSMPNQLFSKRFRPVWAGLTIVAILAIAFSFAPVRAWAGQFLGLFRVQQITVLPIDTTRLSELSGNETIGSQISQLFSKSVKVTRQPGDPQVAASAAEASQLAGFTVRLPDNRSDAPELTVQGGTAFEFTVDRNLAQGILNEAGRSDLQLPAALDGATMAVDIPAGVTAAYGNCPKVEGSNETGSPGRRFATCVVLAQIPSPAVTAPPDLDVAQLAQIGLQFTGMSAEEAQAFSQTVDWASTLVVPIPRNGAVYTQVPMDGVTGYLIQRPADDAPQYAVIWVKDGILYAIGGLGSNSSAALEMADSLK